MFLDQIGDVYDGDQVYFDLFCCFLLIFQIILYLPNNFCDKLEEVVDEPNESRVSLIMCSNLIIVICHLIENFEEGKGLAEISESRGSCRDSLK